MKKYTALLLLVLIVQSSCKKFLEVESLHRISGNNYWKSKADVEAFTVGLYAKFRNKLTQTSFIPATGDLRTGYIKFTSTGNSNTIGESRRIVYDYLSRNDLKRVVGNYVWNVNLVSGGITYPSMNFNSITVWTEFYQVIQGANILIDQIDKGVPGLSPADEGQYRGEAAFIRSLAYFMMVRIYGDVPYYTDPYIKDAMGRENMVSVVNKCIADVEKYKESLPVAYGDAAFRAVRATKGAALTLQMHMNMWNAGFDKAKATAYYSAAADLGKKLLDLKAYELIPISSFSAVMLGRSQEGIFEFNQSINYEGQPNPIAFFGEMVLRFPNKGAGSDNNSSHAYIKPAYLSKIYGTGTDLRKDFWFNSQTMLAGNGTFEFLKFKGDIVSGATGLYGVPEWDLIIFRYADALLLRAEALAELNKDTEALEMLNMVRARAGAASASEVGQQLKDVIFMERNRELLGDGCLYFDLIRTGRILDSQWTDNWLTPAQFNDGGWTWPIDNGALLNNPLMKLNSYWQ